MFKTDGSVGYFVDEYGRTTEVQLAEVPSLDTPIYVQANSTLHYGTLLNSYTRLHVYLERDGKLYHITGTYIKDTFIERDRKLMFGNIEYSWRSLRRESVRQTLDGIDIFAANWDCMYSETWPPNESKREN
jgi:hypothetical protein